MPKSKRDKKISLTKTNKKGLELKQHIIEDIRSSTDKYDNIFVISVRNMRNNKLKNVREQWQGSRFFFGKKKIMALALGKTPESEILDGVHKLSEALRGQCGLLFTNKPKKEVLKWMKEQGEDAFARSGFVAPETINLSEGPMPDFAHSIEPYLRQLGMPTSLQKGIVTLVKDFQVCKKGQVLTPEQCKILELINRPLAVFKFVVHGVYTKKKGYKHLKDVAEEEAVKEMEIDDD